MNSPEGSRGMRAVVLRGHGGIDQLEYVTDAPIPIPGHDEILVRVGACGMNNTDVNTRTGWYSQSVTTATGEQTAASDADGSWTGAVSFPRIQGADPVGRIVEVGPSVDPDRLGERVMIDAWLRDPQGDLAAAGYLGSERDGGYAEYVSVPAANAHPIHTNLTDVELAGFPCSYSTAEHMLERAGAGEGDCVLVTGASGGVGSALIQLAGRRGAVTLGISTRAKAAVVGELTGADHILDRDSPSLSSEILDLSGGGVDVLADVVGGPLFPKLFDTIRRGGHYAVAGAIGGPTVDLDLRTLYLRDITMHGCTVLPPRVFANLVRYIENGEIRPLVARSYPLHRLRSAQEAFLRKEHVGAIVIDLRAPSQPGDSEHEARTET
ncbi:MAG: alcohol dehydrogenase family protein [bacterium]|nr:alcohol dehydrogenase family protein [bacterium]